ncbi:MAG TPA: hypothetical protein VL985_05675 [Stellaceae bacterium]|nr:hypothetical protein [Stellaceae bacterium]
MNMNREKLLRLQRKLEHERGRILAGSRTTGAGDQLSPQLIREIADIDVAARAVAAELSLHTPRLGYGSVI